MPRVTRIEAFRVSLPLARRTGVRRAREHILVRVADPLGAAGWGEVEPDEDAATGSGLPAAAGEEGGGAIGARWASLARDLGPALLGREWTHPAEAAELWTPRHPDPVDPQEAAMRPPVDRRAAAGLDMACWDLWCRLHDIPLSHALGGTRTAVAAGVCVDREPSLEALIDRVNQHVRGGYGRVKLRIEPGWDIEPVRAVRKAYPGLAVQVDACGAYSEDADHLAALEALDAYRLVLIEQPFPAEALAAHARLQRRMSTPLCIGVTDPAGLATAFALGAGRVLDLRVSRAGGLTAARRAHDRAAEHGWQVWCGGGGEFGVARAANVALASLPAVTLPSDVSGSELQYTRDVVSPPVRATHGMVPVPLAQPGLGHEVDEDLVRRLAVDTLCLTA